MELESHAGTSHAQPLSVIAIVARDQLPAFRGGASSDVAMTSIWWWARIVRWDVAAHIVGMTERAPLRGVLSDVRTESIVEIARWDLDLAEHLVTAWDGEPSLLPSLLKDWRRVSAPVMNGGHGRVTGIIGAPRLGSILRGRFDPPVDAGGLVEIGALDTVVRWELGAQHSDVREASRWLRQARNDLAHMRPLSLGDQKASRLPVRSCSRKARARSGRIPQGETGGSDGSPAGGRTGGTWQIHAIACAPGRDSVSPFTSAPVRVNGPRLSAPLAS